MKAEKMSHFSGDSILTTLVVLVAWMYAIFLFRKRRRGKRQSATSDPMWYDTGRTTKNEESD